MLHRIDERNLPSFVEKSAKKKDSSFTNGNVPRELIDKVYAIKVKYKDFGSSRIYKLKNNGAAAAFFFDKISKAKESRGGKYGWAVELKSVDSYANKAEDQQKPEEKGNKMRLFILDSGNSGFAIKADGTLVSVFTHKDADKNDINMILAMAVEYGADKLDCYTAKNKLTDLYSKFGFKETGRTAFNHEYAPDDAPDYVKNDEFEGSQLPQNQGRTDLRPTEERPDVAFMHRPQNTPRTGSSILKSKDTNTNYNKKRTTTPSAIGGDYMDEEMKNQSAAAKSKVRGRQTHLQRDWMNQSFSFEGMVKNVLGESSLTSSIKNVMKESHDEDYLEIVASDLYEWLMEVGSNSLLDDFKPQQLKNVIKMKLKKEKFIPNDDTEMANWCRKNEDDIIETVARATGAYSMSREDFLKKQREEEEVEESPVPEVTVTGKEIIYNKKGSPRGIKIDVKDCGSCYLKFTGVKNGIRQWSVECVKDSGDEKVWEMVKNSIEKMSEKIPSTIIRTLRNKSFTLPSWQPATIGESICHKKKIKGFSINEVQEWLDKNKKKS